MPPRPSSKPPELPASMLDLTGPALPGASLETLASMADASPAEFQSALGIALRSMVVQGFRTLQAPRSWKEQATALDLLRKVEGWGEEKGNGMPAGLVGVIRAVNRRPVMMEAETVEDCPEFE